MRISLMAMLFALMLLPPIIAAMVELWQHSSNFAASAVTFVVAVLILFPLAIWAITDNTTTSILKIRRQRALPDKVDARSSEKVNRKSARDRLLLARHASNANKTAPR